MTNIYNITYYSNNNSLYILFKGCNFYCKGCYIKDTVVDYHLPDHVKRHLQRAKNFKLLPLNQFREVVKDILEKLDVKEAVLGGEEPTLDAELPDVIDVLTQFGIKTLLTTNGSILNEKTIEKLEEAGLSSVRMSVKAYDENIHKIYTGQTNKTVLNNFKLLAESQIKLSAESILIPGLVEYDEIERIAKFIASIDPAIPYRVDGFVPFHGAPWRSPTPEEVVVAAKVARKYLRNVHYLHCKSGGEKREVINIYPAIRDDNSPHMPVKVEPA
ncbi:MAG: radical SAM protein [Nitrososphaerota archaeon]|nr:radical SAM protein [Candidatus Bathyarchaeota archaeon]MDW8022530.1 radical SAM protein [Nitrososphaerota archaeon]